MPDQSFAEIGVHPVISEQIKRAQAFKRKNNPSRTRKFEWNPLRRTVRPELALLGVAAGTVLSGQAIAKELGHTPPLDMSSVIIEPVSAAHSVASDVIKMGAHPQKYEQPKVLVEYGITEADGQKVMETVPVNLKLEAKKSIPLVIQALKEQQINSKLALAFTLANLEYEANFDLTNEEMDGKAQAKKLGYGGGIWGHGGFMLTHDYNFEKYGKILREKYPEYRTLNLVKTPNRASEPMISARIMAAFVKEERLLPLLEEGKFEEARKKIAGNYDDDDEYNKQITKYIINRTNSYFQLLKQ